MKLKTDTVTIIFVCNGYKIKEILVDKFSGLGNGDTYYYTEIPKKDASTNLYVIMVQNGFKEMLLSIHSSEESAQAELYGADGDSAIYIMYECMFSIGDNGEVLSKSIDMKYHCRRYVFDGKAYNMLSHAYQGKPSKPTKWIWQTDEEFESDLKRLVDNLPHKQGPSEHRRIDGSSGSISQSGLDLNQPDIQNGLSGPRGQNGPSGPRGQNGLSGPRGPSFCLISNSDPFKYNQNLTK
jgi:hypothetical protein